MTVRLLMQEIKILQSMVSGRRIMVLIGASNLFPGVHGRLVRLIKAV